MEKNLLEHFLAKASEIWSGLKTQHDHPMYTPDSSGLSGVEKYLAKLEQAAKQKEAATLAAQATGVEKYLARQQAFSPKAVQEVPTTGVGKYLARQTLTGSVSPKQPLAIPKTGVGKYLAGIPLTKEGATPTPVPVTEKKQPQQNKFEPKKTTAPAKEPPPSDKIKEMPSAAISKTSAPATAAATTSVAPAGDVIHFENVTQCQSRTLKGTQCKNTRHLTKLQRTINKQKYQFSACPQHHNDTFKPYPPLLEPH